MARPTLTVPTPSTAALLDRAIAYTTGSLNLVTPAALRRPTPCAAWTLADLLAHMNDSFQALYEAATHGHIPAPSSSKVVGTGAGGLRGAACATLGAWAGAVRSAVVSVGGLPLAAEVVAGVGAVEVTLHGWDVAQACGQPRPIPAALAGELLELAALFVTPADRPTRFAPPRAVPPDASAEARLLASLGRDPGRAGSPVDAA